MDTKTLIEQHTPLALSIGNEFFQSYPKFTQTELVSEAYVGLMKAGGSFDASKGIAFGSFAKVVIRNHILDYLSKQGTYVDRIKLTEDLQQNDLSQSSGLEELDEIDPFREVHRAEIKKLLLTQRNRLTQSQQEMINLLSLGHSYAEIGEKIGISKQAVHKSVQKALESMREGLQKSGVNDIRYALPTIEKKLPHPTFWDKNGGFVMLIVFIVGILIILSLGVFLK